MSPVGAELLHANGLTELKLIVTRRNFAKAPKHCKLPLYKLSH